MAGLGFPELIVICIIALLIFGPRKLPEAGKALGQAIRGFKSSMEGKGEPPEAAAAIPAHLSCPACHGAVQAAAAFCARCGQALETDARKRAA